MALLDAEHLDTDAPATVLDVRQADEFATGHNPGARNIELGALREQSAQVPPGPVLIMCGHGERAMGAASVLERAGHTDISVFDGGPLDHARAHGQQLQVDR
ncbi:hypothetical protein GCM10027199_84410 [Amycolatopsis magusensis]